MKVFLIRHGRSVSAEQRISQNMDIGLSETGASEIQNIKETVFDIIEFDKIYCSPLPRAKETAQILFGDRTIEIEEVPFIKEYERPSRLYGVDLEITREYWETNKEKKYEADWKPEDGESFNEIKSRAEKFTQLVESGPKDATVAVVAHGIFFKHLIGYWAMREDYKPKVFFDLLWKFDIHNGAYIELEVGDTKDDFRVKKWSA